MSLDLTNRSPIKFMKRLMLIFARILPFFTCVLRFFFKIIRALLKIRRYVVITSIFFCILSPIVINCASDYIIWPNVFFPNGEMSSQELLKWLNTYIVTYLNNNTWAENLGFRPVSHPVFQQIGLALSNFLQNPDAIKLFQEHLSNFVNTMVTNKFTNEDGTINHYLYDVLTLLTSGKIDLSHTAVQTNISFLTNSLFLETYSFIFAMCSNPDSPLYIQSKTRYFKAYIQKLHEQAEADMNRALNGFVVLTDQEGFGGISKTDNPEVRESIRKECQKSYWQVVGIVTLASFLLLSIGIGMGVLFSTIHNLPVETVNIGKDLIPNTNTSLIVRN